MKINFFVTKWWVEMEIYEHIRAVSPPELLIYDYVGGPNSSPIQKKYKKNVM